MIIPDPDPRKTSGSATLPLRNAAHKTDKISNKIRKLDEYQGRLGGAEILVLRVVIFYALGQKTFRSEKLA